MSISPSAVSHTESVEFPFMSNEVGKSNTDDFATGEVSVLSIIRRLGFNPSFRLFFLTGLHRSLYIGGSIRSISPAK